MDNEGTIWGAVIISVILVLLYSTSGDYEKNGGRCYNGYYQNVDTGKCKSSKPWNPFSNAYDPADDYSSPGSLDYHDDYDGTTSTSRSSKDCLRHGKHGCKKWKTPEQIYAEKQKFLNKFIVDDKDLEQFYEIEQKLLNDIKG